MTVTILADELRVCIDCTMILANGELGMGDDAADEAHAARMEAHDGRGVMVLACPEDCEGEFSWRSCDGCGSTLGGDRHPAAIFDH